MRKITAANDKTEHAVNYSYYTDYTTHFFKYASRHNIFTPTHFNEPCHLLIDYYYSPP